MDPASLPPDPSAGVQIRRTTREDPGTRVEQITGPARTDDHVAELLSELLRRTHLSSPSDLAAIAADQARSIGAQEVDLYLINYDLDELVPIVTRDGARRETLSLAGTIAGRAYTSTTILKAPHTEDGPCRVWVPLIDGTDRLGVIGLTFPSGPISEPLLRACERYAHLTAVLLVTKGAYGDTFQIARRRRPMTIASELTWSLAPPLVFATDRLVLAGMLEPAYDNGGDALDYAVDDGVLHLAVFDAMGHGLAAAGVAAFAIAAYRHSRRRGLDLIETYNTMHTAVADQFPGERYVTAVIAQLDLASGTLTWISAGHPPPLVIRNGRTARILSAPPCIPLGIPFDGPAPRTAEEALEPGDLVLFYTDGLTEARRPDGRPFTTEGLSAFIEREAAGGHPAPETLRRLRHTIAAEQTDAAKDDATAVLVEWNSGHEVSLLPPTTDRPG
jgi:hypothetical protein